MDDCIFCQIANGNSPAEIEYEDPEIIGFWDIHPKAPVHILIIPKKHISSLETLGEKDFPILAKMFMVAKSIAKKKNLVENGYRTVINYGKQSGMEVDHLHLHLLGVKKWRK